MDALIKNTLFGDANLDGRVDGSDYTKIDNGFNSPLSGWSNGDFNYDGLINGSDYTLIDNAFNTQVGSPAPITLTAPTTAEIDLAWSDTSGPTVEGYDVFRSTTFGFTPDDSNFLIFNPDPNFQDSGLLPSTTYYYNVQAVHQDGSLTPVASNVSATTLTSDTIAPLQPTDLIGEGVSSSDVNLSWTDNSNNETGFLIEYAHSGQGDWTVAKIAPPHTTGDTVYLLNDGTDYDFRVTAMNSVQTTAAAGILPAVSPATTTSPTTTATTQSINGKTVFIAIIGGNFQNQAKLNTGFGLGALAKVLNNGQHPEFDVHVFASYLQENINDNGTGYALREVNAAFAKGVRLWSLIGYSHGAGSAFNLDQQVHAADVLHQPVPLKLSYSAYVQGVSHNFAFDLASQSTPPVDSKMNGNFFSNWYENNDTIGVHAPISVASQNHHVLANDDGSTVLHTTIDKQQLNLISPLAMEATDQIVTRGG